MAFTYLTLAYIKLRCDARVLVQLTNDDSRVDSEDPSNIQIPQLESAENDAAQTVNNFMRDLYDLPLVEGSTLTPEIKGMVASLTWCNLWERRGDEPEQVTKLRDRVLKRLDEMAKPGARETRGDKSPNSSFVRSTRGPVATMFENSGYFDGLPFRGRRPLPRYTEGGEGASY